jgi:hypothetical protein
MKTLLRGIPVLLGLALAPPLPAVPNILLYPFARAFGGPSEAELVKCRAAFQELQQHLPDRRILVLPVLSDEDGRSGTRADLAQALIRRTTRATGARLGPAAAAAGVEPSRFHEYHNQLRYTWSRAAEYARWVKANPPPADYVWCVEVFSRGGFVDAIEVYLFDAHGQLAYCRLFNSHQFRRLPLKALPHFVTDQFLENLQWAPEKLFPPYGVG